MPASQTEGDSQLFATLWLLGLVSHHEISSYTGLAHVIPTFTPNQVKITQKVNIKRTKGIGRGLYPPKESITEKPQPIQR